MYGRRTKLCKNTFFWVRDRYLRGSSLSSGLELSKTFPDSKHLSTVVKGSKIRTKPIHLNEAITANGSLIKCNDMTQERGTIGRCAVLNSGWFTPSTDRGKVLEHSRGSERSLKLGCYPKNVFPRLFWWRSVRKQKA